MNWSSLMITSLTVILYSAAAFAVKTNVRCFGDENIVAKDKTDNRLVGIYLCSKALKVPAVILKDENYDEKIDQEDSASFYVSKKVDLFEKYLTSRIECFPDMKERFFKKNSKETDVYYKVDIRDLIEEGSTADIESIRRAIQSARSADGVASEMHKATEQSSGEVVDDESLYRQRMYDPQTARFLIEDPKGFAGGHPNLYQYGYNNPLRFTDPMGLAPGDIFSSTNEAGADASNYTNARSISENREYGAWIYGSQQTGYTYTEPIRGTANALIMTQKPYGTESDFHTHGASTGRSGDERFSAADIISNMSMKTSGYLATPSGNFLLYDPSKGVSVPRTCK